MNKFDRVRASHGVTRIRWPRSSIKLPCSRKKVEKQQKIWKVEDKHKKQKNPKDDKKLEKTES